jgi:uncharacterized protein YuzE
MNKDLDKPLNRRSETQDIEKRMQKTLSPERKALIDNAEKVTILSGYKLKSKKKKEGAPLGELVEKAIQAWALKDYVINYDEGADVLYINFHKPPLKADNTTQTENMIRRYFQGKLIGVTIINFSEEVKISFVNQVTEEKK